MPFASVGDIEIYHERIGAGPRLLFISGTGGDLHASAPNVLDGPFPKHFDMLAYDQRGLGQTSKPDRPYSMAEYAEDAVGPVAAIGWGSALVVGALLRRHGGAGTGDQSSPCRRGAGAGLHLAGRRRRGVLPAPHVATDGPRRPRPPHDPDFRHAPRRRLGHRQQKRPGSRWSPSPQTIPIRTNPATPWASAASSRPAPPTTHGTASATSAARC